MKKIYRILIIIFIILVLFLTLSYFKEKNKIKREWEQVKFDFEIVNNFLIDYYDKNCFIECIEEENMYFDINIEDSKVKLSVNHGKNIFEVDDQLKKSMLNISEYYIHKVSGFSDTLDYIRVKKQTIEYASELHSPKVIYYKEKKPSLNEIHENKLERLSDNWYKTEYEHHL